MLALAIETNNNHFLIDVNEIDKIVAIPHGLVLKLNMGVVPNQIFICGKIRNFKIASSSVLKNLDLKIGSRLILPKNHDDIVILVQMVRGLFEIIQDGSEYQQIAEEIYKSSSVQELLCIS